MKKILSAILALCLILGAVFTLVACGGGGGGAAKGEIPNGTYVGEDMTFKIKGDKMYMTEMLDSKNGVEMVYKYKLNADKTEITATFYEVNPIGGGEEIDEAVEYLSQELNEEHTSDFEFTDDGVMIDGDEFVKQ